MKAEILRLINETERKKFFGKVELEYRNGEITLIRLNETVLPDQLGQEERRKGWEPNRRLIAS